MGDNRDRNREKLRAWHIVLAVVGLLIVLIILCVMVQRNSVERRIAALRAQEHLADLVQVSSCLVRLTDVERAVCDVFEIDPRSLRSARKLRALNQPRMLAMWLARKYTRAGLSEISEHFGRRSHSTVISAHRKVDGWLNQGATVEGPHGTWKAEDALRKIERLLQSA